MRRLILTFVLASLAACGPTVTEENAVETCQTALLRNMVATALTNQQAGMTAGMNVEEAILGSLFQACSIRAALEQAMGPGVTIAEYCESKEHSEIKSMALDADIAIAVYASTRGIPRTVAEDHRLDSRPVSRTLSWRPPSGMPLSR